LAFTIFRNLRATLSREYFSHRSTNSIRPKKDFELASRLAPTATSDICPPRIARCWQVMFQKLSVGARRHQAFIKIQQVGAISVPRLR